MGLIAVRPAPPFLPMGVLLLFALCSFCRAAESKHQAVDSSANTAVAAKAIAEASSAASSAQASARVAESAASSVAGVQKKLEEASKGKLSFPIKKLEFRPYKLPGCDTITWTWLVSVFCPEPNRPIQSGDTLILAVRTTDLEAAVKAHDAHPVLFINDISLGADSKYSHVDEAGDLQMLRYQLKDGKSSQELWTSIYRESGLAVPGDAKIAVGWGSTIVFNQSAAGADERVLKISAGTPSSGWTAFGFACVLVALFVYCMGWTSVFRDSKLPTFWMDARTLRMAIQDHLYPEVLAHGERWEKPVNWTTNQSVILQVIQVTYANYAYPAAPDISLDVLADRARLGDLPAAALWTNTTVGLATSDIKWRRPRLSYSLARVQSGMWLLFSLVTAVFIWVVFGGFPSIGGSVVSLMAVSTITAGASVIVDKNSSAPATYSHGLFNDLLTGPMNDAQPHRFQSVMVNLMLLSAGVVYVVQYLWYPTFDSSWLGLLGISGAALVAGKQTLETPKDSKRTGNPS